MAVEIVSSAIRTCLGDGPRTFAALLRGADGASELRYHDASKLNVSHAYHIIEGDRERPLRASVWLTECILDAVAASDIDAQSERVIAVVGTGLRELRSVEQWATKGDSFCAEQLHFGTAVKAAVPGVSEVITLSNACSAGGHALAIAQDLLESSEADVAIAAGTDSLTASMLAMVGRFREKPVHAIRPFDASESGVLLGEGAAAIVLRRSTMAGARLCRVLSTGLSCDAHHETAPHPDGMRRAMHDALERASVPAAAVNLVVAHGTGTMLNDPLEAALVREVYGAHGPGPLITALKGAIGHTSGGSALMSVDVALRAMKSSRIPPVVGLHKPLAESAGLQFVMGEPAQANIQFAVVNAFGFGGVNSVTVLGNAA